MHVNEGAKAHKASKNVSKRASPVGKSGTQVGTGETEVGTFVTKVGKSGLPVGTGEASVGTLDVAVGTGGLKVGNLMTEVGTVEMKVPTLITDLPTGVAEVVAIFGVKRGKTKISGGFEPKRGNQAAAPALPADFTDARRLT